MESRSAEPLPLPAAAASAIAGSRNGRRSQGKPKSEAGEPGPPKDKGEPPARHPECNESSTASPALAPATGLDLALLAAARRPMLDKSAPATAAVREVVAAMVTRAAAAASEAAAAEVKNGAGDEAHFVDAAAAVAAPAWKSHLGFLLSARPAAAAPSVGIVAN